MGELGRVGVFLEGLALALALAAVGGRGDGFDGALPRPGVAWYGIATSKPLSHGWMRLAGKGERVQRGCGWVLRGHVGIYCVCIFRAYMLSSLFLLLLMMIIKGVVGAFLVIHSPRGAWCSFSRMFGCGLCLGRGNGVLERRGADGVGLKALWFSSSVLSTDLPRQETASSVVLAIRLCRSQGEDVVNSLGVINTVYYGWHTMVTF